MMMLLEAGTGGNNVFSYILIAVVALLLIAMPIMMNAKNKKESQKVQEQTNSLKVGDKILTTSGVYGTITEVKFDDAKKMVVIETGGETKSYMSIDAYSIYTVFKSEEELKKEAEAKAEAERKILEEAQKAAEEKQAAKEAKKAKKSSNTEKTEVIAEENPAEVVEEKAEENK